MQPLVPGEEDEVLIREMLLALLEVFTSRKAWSTQSPVFLVSGALPDDSDIHAVFLDPAVSITVVCCGKEKPFHKLVQLRPQGIVMVSFTTKLLLAQMLVRHHYSRLGRANTTADQTSTSWYSSPSGGIGMQANYVWSVQGRLSGQSRR